MIPKMDWKAADTVEAFQFYKQKMEMYFRMKKINAALQVDYILTGSGDEGIRRFNTWKLSEADRQDPAIVWNKFKSQIEGSTKQNFRVARLKLHHYQQKPTESLDEFVTRCQEQAGKCDFEETEKSERIIELLVASTPIEDFQKYLLDQPKNTDLETILVQGRKYEARISNQREIKEQNSEAIHVNTAYMSKGNCKCCGLDHPRQRDACPASKDTCNYCHKKGHWSKFCLAKANSKSTPMHSREPKGRKKHKRRQQKQKYKQHEVNNDGDSDSDDFDLGEITVSSINKRASSDKELFTRLEITLPGIKKQATLRVKIDTGAGGNTIPHHLYKEILNRKRDKRPLHHSLELKPTTATLTAYNGSHIECYGKINIPVKHQQQTIPTPFYVVKTQGPAIIGLPSCRDLGLVHVTCDIATVSNTEEIVENTTKAVINTKEDLLRSYPEQFDKIGKLPGKATILLKDNVTPYADPPRKWPIHIQKTLANELRKQTEMGIIKPVEGHTDWCSSMTYVMKPDGNVRTCLDPSKLNKAIKRCPHKTPTTEELSYKFQGAQYFTKLDAHQGYYSVELDEQSQLLTTFRTPIGRYCYLRLPMGLATSQDIFQSKMDFITSQCTGAVGIADDIVIYGATETEHNENLQQFMKVAKENGLTLNSKKCYVKQTQIKFFGTIYGREGMKPDPEKVEDIKQIPTPTTKKELQQFIGMIQYLSPFIPDLATHSAPLRDLLKDSVPFQWESDHQHCFEQLKTMISTDAILQYYNTKKPATVMTDASQRGLGAVLLQPVNGQLRPVAYASKSLTETQSNYSNIERELLGICFGVERFRTYLFGTHFHVITDHKPLVNILNKNVSAAPPRLQRMVLRLQGYSFDIQHAPGKEVGVADAISRLPNPHNNEEIPLAVHVHAAKISHPRRTELREMTATDPVLECLRDITIAGWPADIKQVPTDIRQYWNFRDEITVYDGLLLKGGRIIIPERLREDMLKRLHQGHMGITKTVMRAKTAIFWPGINKDIEKLCKHCPTCDENKPAQQKEPLKPHTLPTSPWQKLGSDIFTIEQVQYLIITDYYSKYPIVRKLPTPCPSEKLAKITKQIFAEFGIPETLISDNGPHYVGQPFKDLMNDLEVQHITSSPRYPKSNGQAERSIQTVKNIIKKTIKNGEDINMALLTLRTTPIDSHLKSPAEILFQRKIKANLPIITPNTLTDRDEIAERLTERQDKYKTNYDRSAKDLDPLYEGQSVLVQDQDTGKWKPGTVKLKCVEPRSYIIAMPNGRLLRRNRVHIRGTVARTQLTLPDETATPRQRENYEQSRDDNNGQSRNDNNNNGQSRNDYDEQSAKTTAKVKPTPAETPRRTRSGRLIVKPARFN